MLKYKFKWIALVVVALAYTSCEDPDTTFDPINPDLTPEAITGTPQSTTRILVGIERQLALAYQELGPPTEIASDNYVNTQTFYNQFVDKLDINKTDNDVNDMQFDIARLRELAIFARDVIAPADEGATEDQVAEIEYFIGVGLLLGGQYFTTLPSTPGGVPMSSADNLQLADEQFVAAASKTENVDIKAAALLGSARARYLQGDKSGAVAAADEAIALAPDFVRYVNFDALNGPVNTLQDALHDRATLDDLQPLPRLDFLDPKFNDQDPTADFGIPLFKIEEAHLIKCEAAIADGALGDAQSIMKDILGLVASRPTATFDEGAEDRIEGDPGIRPDTSSVVVAASPGAPFRSGLVLDRNTTTTVPTISGTSVTEEMIDAVGSEDEALELLYLMRQEIFIAESQRVTDMGLKFVVSETEELANPNVKDTDVLPTIPPFLAAISNEIDAMTYDAAAGTCTITHDINAIIVANKTSDFVCPFH